VKNSQKATEKQSRSKFQATKKQPKINKNPETK
jgi:hypothetical protein